MVGRVASPDPNINLMAKPIPKLHKDVLQYSNNGWAVRFRVVEDEVFIPVTDLRRFFNIKYSQYPAYQLCPSASRIVFYNNGDTLQSIVTHDIPFLCKCGKLRELTKNEADKFEWVRTIRNHILYKKDHPEVHEQSPALKTFSSPFGSIRIVADEHGDPLFCLADLCKCVELQNPSSVKSRLDASDIQLIDLHALNSTDPHIGNAKTNFVTESGYYDVILQSSSPKAKPFRKWVTSEVLPSIRKTGGYVMASENDDPEVVMARGLMAAKEALERAEQRALAAESKYTLAKPKVEYYDAVITSRDLYTTQQIAGELGMCYRTLRSKLFKLGVCTTLTGKLIPQSDYESWGEMESVTGKKKSSAFKWNKEGRRQVFALIAPELPV